MSKNIFVVLYNKLAKQPFLRPDFFKINCVKSLMYCNLTDTHTHTHTHTRWKRLYYLRHDATQQSLYALNSCEETKERNT